MTPHLGVLTSGGDSPGMNGAVRSVVRTALSKGVETYAIRFGYQGIFDGKFEKMTSYSVSGLLNRGGSFIGCSRCQAMLEPGGPARAVELLRAQGIDKLIVIGGDGSFRGMMALEQSGMHTVGLPGTIDNDIPGLDRTIGFDTACDTLSWCINRLRDTAESHHRTFVVEAMGRNSGWLALHGGMAGGADVILIPEVAWTPKGVLDTIMQRISEGRTFHLVIIAEGAGRATDLVNFINLHAPMPIEVRACIPGHIQRGGAPTTIDRIMATRTGYAAVHAILEGRHGVVVGQLQGQVVEVPLSIATDGSRTIDLSLYELALTVA
jgi:6-phosphofructokinase 1